eukprot:8958512-Heterocapsa_arctica.AAC.1
MGAIWGDLSLVSAAAKASHRVAGQVDGDDFLEHDSAHQELKRWEALLPGQILAEAEDDNDQGG